MKILKTAQFEEKWGPSGLSQQHSYDDQELYRQEANEFQEEPVSSIQRELSSIREDGIYFTLDGENLFGPYSIQEAYDEFTKREKTPEGIIPDWAKTGCIFYDANEHEGVYEIGDFNDFVSAFNEDLFSV